MINSEKTYQQLLAYLSANLNFLPDKPDETPASTLDALWYHSCKKPRPLKQDANRVLPEIDKNSLQILESLVQQRISGVPLSYITGVERFMGVEYKVDKRALIPRKETETLGYAALELINKIAVKQKKVRIMDVCTGMGNLALSFAFHQSKAEVWASDLSPEAISLAKLNAQRLNLENQVIFLTGDLFEPFSENSFSEAFDIITCNPPYISTAKVGKMPEEISAYEPRMAFNGGNIGLQIVLRLINESPRFIIAGGWLCFEIGQGQGPGIMKFMKNNKDFDNITPVKDNAGEIRVILGQVKK